MSSERRQPPTLIAMGGGKGGIGKSVVSLLLGQWLARLGHRTTVVDLDFSGANLHTLLGIAEAPATIHDVMSRRVATLEEIAVALDPPGFRAICGASEILSTANPVFARKLKLMRGLFALDTDFVVLDLGAGTSFNVLDFFLLADLQILLTTAEPTSICNAYACLRNAVFRRLAQLTRNQPSLQEIVAAAMEGYGRQGLRTLGELYQALEDFGGAELTDPIRHEMSQIHPLVLVNRVQNVRERNATKVLQQVAAKYLELQLEDLGALPEDSELRGMVARMIPLTRGGLYRGAFEEARSVALRLVTLARRRQAQLQAAGRQGQVTSELPASDDSGVGSFPADEVAGRPRTADPPAAGAAGLVH
ncbi:MAG: hypothetical protein Kow001_19090 [Acidobacteriota bacterium]